MSSVGLGVHAHGLRKAFGKFQALDDLELDVPAGTVGGVLGPNGAGKTTTIRILTTLLDADAGSATVGGYDVMRAPHSVRSVIALTGQYAAVDADLTGHQNLVMIGRLCHLTRRQSRKRADELLERFALSNAATRLARNYSGGMRRRLDLAASLVNPPTVLFLDEPTTGLDPPSRNELWEVVRELRQTGTTIVLTTQYLEEADRLADDITVIDHGRAVAKGTAAQLKAEVGGDVIEIYAHDHDLAWRAAHLLAGKIGIGEDAVTTDVNDLHTTVSVEPGRVTVVDVVRLLEGENLRVDDVRIRQASLDEVFSVLTKRR